MNPTNGLYAKVFLEHIKKHNLVIAEHDYNNLMVKYKSLTDFLLFCINENKIAFRDYPCFLQDNVKLLLKLGSKKPSIYAEIKRARADIFSQIVKLFADGKYDGDVPNIIVKELLKLEPGNSTKPEIKP